MQEKKITILGGDLRIVKLAEMLVKDGYEVYSYGMEKAEKVEMVKCSTIEEAVQASDMVIGPLPLSSNGVTINAPFSEEKIEWRNVIEKLQGKTFIAGAIRQEVYQFAEGKEIQFVDLLKREELSVLNAISTAEGAIQIAISETAQTLHGSNILVLGFGRIGKILAKMLDGMGAKVACEARKSSDLAWIQAYGYEPIHLKNLDENLHRFDIIINTIPFVVIDEHNIDQIKKEALIIDLASNPGGVDKQEVKKHNLKFVWALSLPGKVAPVTSAQYIKETLYNVLEEMEKNQE